MLILGIETSCDETALALVEDGRKIVATQMASSLKLHQRYGGVVPEIASRAHVELMTYELEALLKGASVSADDIDRIAVTYGPGLSGCLLTGIAAAKALGMAWGKEIVRVNHLHAHLYAALMKDAPWEFKAPMVGLVISGGHTAIVSMREAACTLLGQTRDDAVGEAFDKVAKLLGLGFPGGPEIERTAQEGKERSYRFQPPKMKSGSLYDFSLSGIKTAVLYKARELEKKTTGTLPQDIRADLAASFQFSVVEEVVAKTISACRNTRVNHLVVGGGVVANSLLRKRLTEACAESKINVAVPPMSLCTDNGAMVAGLGYHQSPVALTELTAVANLRVERNS